MNGTTTITASFRRSRRGGRVVFGDEPATAPQPVREPERRPARIAIQLALAWKIRWAIDDGRLASQAEAARRLGVSKARVSQLLAMTMLPVAEQERILFLEAVGGREPGTERRGRRSRTGP